MLGSHTDELYQLVNAATNWREAAATAGVALTQLNVVFPDGRPLVLFWNEQAIDNGDGTFTGDWVVTPS